jgi:hypothetical protein
MQPHLVHHTNRKTAKKLWVFLAHTIVEILRITQLLQIPNFTSTIRFLKPIPYELSTLQLNLKYKFIAMNNTSLLFNTIHNATQENKYFNATMFSPSWTLLKHITNFKILITTNYNSGKSTFLASRCVKSLN